MVENTSFISSILAAPSDDAPRLIYADWLEEQGDGTRAEFIRLQCELAQIEVGFKANADAKVSTHELIHMANTLRRREQELFNPNWFQMDGVPGKADFDRHWNRFIYTVQHPQQKGACLLLAPIKRGFIAEAHTTLKVWMGTECPNCYVRPNENDEPRSCCALCLDTGRLPGYGRDVVTVQPIEAVYLTDKQPLRLLNNNGECHRWFISKRILNENDNHVLPQQLFSFLLPGGIPARPLGPPWFWETEQDAQNALATALIAWAKSSPQRLTPA